MNMMNKCARFHKDSPSEKKVKLNLPSAIELSETAVFVYNFSETLCKWATSLAHLTNFSFKFFYDIFTDDASLPLILLCKKVKNDQNSNQWGSCLKFVAS